jgi:hypothetical protein
MKKYITLLIASVALLLGQGCASLNGGGDASKEIVFWANTAALLGTQEAIAKNPELRPKFELALASLNALVDAGSTDPLAFRNVLNTLPVKELKSREARIAINLASIAFYRYGQSVALDDKSHVASALRAVRDGIRDGLAKS